MNIDVSIILWVQETFGPAARPFWEVITNLGDVILAVTVIALMLWLKGTRFGLRVGLIAILSGLFVQTLKVLVMEPRPYYANEALYAWRDSDGFGMPSGHSSSAVAVWGTLALLLKRWWLYPLSGALILLIGLSRIYFGVHSPSQVLAGWAAGSIVLLGWLIYEQRVINWLRKFSTGIQVGMAVAATMVMLGFSTFALPALEANFAMPDRWVERHQEAQSYEASLDGESVETFKALELFNSPALDEIGLFLGIMLLGIYVLKHGGFENFSRREQIANVVIGLVTLAILVPLMDVVETSFVMSLIFWAILPLILGLAVPAAGRWGVGRLGKKGG